MNNRLNNTKMWLGEYAYGVEFRDMPELSLSEPSSNMFRTKNLIMLGDYSETLALIISFKRKGEMLIVPLSNYTVAANEYEILLPNSNLVASTWNARVVKKDEIGDVLSIGSIDDEDLKVITNHYMAIFHKEKLSYSYAKLTGIANQDFSEENLNILFRYMKEESDALPENVFTVLGDVFEDEFKEDLKAEAFSIESSVPEKTNPIIDFVSKMPGVGIFDGIFLEQKAASKKIDPKDFDKK